MYKKSLFAILLFLLTFTYRIHAAERVSIILEYDGKSHLYENEKITLVVNGATLTSLPMQPVILDDRTYVPAREVFESLGAVVDWKAETKQIYIGYGDTLIILEIGKPYININGNITPLSVTPKIINDKTMIPVRFAAEALDFTVGWNDTTKTVSITEPYVQPPVTPAPPVAETPPPVTPASGPTARDISAAGIPEQNHPLTQITDIIISGGNAYTIAASSPISRVDKFLLEDNRLVIDIYNAEMALPFPNYDINGSYLKSIRAAQNQTAPVMVTRVVFDITSPVGFSVSISGDRRSLSVSFENNYISDFSFVREGNVDKIIIRGSTAPTVSLTSLTNPYRLAIDMPLSTLTNARDMPVNGSFVSMLRSSQFDAGTVRIVVDLKAPASYFVSQSGNVTTVSISGQAFQNVSYDSSAKTVIISKSGLNGLNASQITQTDDYLNLKYSFALPGDYFELFGSGTLPVNDGYVSSLTVTNVNGKTSVIINESRVLAYIVTEDAANIYIRAMLPKQKYSKIVIIDPGHGGSAPGTSGNGMIEKDVTLDIALRLIKLLEADGTVKAYATRLDDSYVDNGYRAIFANDLGDIFVSVHINAFNKIAEGTETLYYPHANDATIGISCQEMAELFQKNMLADLGTVDRKAKYQDVQVLRETVIPAILSEVSFVDSPNDAANLKRDDYRQSAAASLAKSILQTFTIYQPRR